MDKLLYLGILFFYKKQYFFTTPHSLARDLYPYHHANGVLEQLLYAY